MNGCGGIIPGTDAPCGRAGFYCETECFHEQLRREGAAAAFAIVGMFDAIKRTYGWRIAAVERTYWTALDGRRVYSCDCPACGVLMSNMLPGGEGTDAELCGCCYENQGDRA